MTDRISPTPLLLLLLLLALPTAAASAVERMVSVRATGTVSAEADMALFSLAVMTTAPEAAGAAAMNAEGVAAVRKALAAAGIAKRDMPTASYSVGARYAWDAEAKRQRQLGYQAEHRLSVRVRDLTRLGAVIDAAVGAGAGEVGAVRFLSSRHEELRREAIRKAIEAARQEASLMAESAGAKLGSIVELVLEDAAPGVPERVLAVRSETANGTRLEPSEQEISATVSTRWSMAGMLWK